MLKVVIIDDEEPARTIIRSFLGEFTDLQVAGEFSDGFAGMKGIQELKPDIVFLDIQMPRLTGFELLELLENPPVIIFSTAYDQYAIRAFELNATDYLLKPYSKDRFRQAVQKAIARVGKGENPGAKLKRVAEEAVSTEESLVRIAVKSGSKIQVVPVSDVIYLEAEGDYVMIHTADARYLKEKTLKYFESHLDPAQFIRIHRSSIVNATYIGRIELYDKESYMVLLKNGVKLRASSSGYKLLKDTLKL
jgi:two-component system, LytTR family, response regulator